MVHIRKIREKIEIDPKNPELSKGGGALDTKWKKQ